MTRYRELTQALDALRAELMPTDAERQDLRSGPNGWSVLSDERDERGARLQETDATGVPITYPTIWEATERLREATR
jgi:hypothetical protein